MNESVPSLEELAATTRRIILSLWPDRFEDAELGDDVALGEDGLGLDSIELAEVVLASEDHTGLSVDEDLFAEQALTIRQLALSLSPA